MRFGSMLLNNTTIHFLWRRAVCVLTLTAAVCSTGSLLAQPVDQPLQTPVEHHPSDSVVQHSADSFIERFRLTSTAHTVDLPEVVATTASLSRSCGHTGPCSQVLPSSLLYRPYIAAPHEPRFSTAALFDPSSGTSRWDASLGSRVGLYRRVRPTNMNLDAWQIDIEGAAMVRLDPQEKMDLEAGDYRFGLLWTGQRDKVTYKVGYFHTSSHIGDEFLIKNPTFQRINYVKESLIVGTSWQASEEWRLYGEVAYGVIATGGAEPFQFQLGTEYAKQAIRVSRGAPFVAANIEMREEVDFTPGASILAGWQWRNPGTLKAFRMGLQFFNGPSNQYSFFDQYDNQIGFGVWYDY